MTKRERIIECMEAMEQGMIRTGYTREIWQNDLIYWLCKSIKLILEVLLRNNLD